MLVVPPHPLSPPGGVWQEREGAPPWKLPATVCHWKTQGREACWGHCRHFLLKVTWLDLFPAQWHRDTLSCRWEDNQCPHSGQLGPESCRPHSGQLGPESCNAVYTGEDGREGYFEDNVLTPAARRNVHIIVFNRLCNFR